MTNARTNANPFARHESAGVAYHLLAGGAAPPLVLLHGIGSDGASFAALAKAFDRSGPVLAWDAPGYGGSRPLDSAWPAADNYALALIGLLDRLGWPSWRLAGQSMGALIAARVAARAPDRVLSLALISPALGYGSKPDQPLPKPVAERVADLERLGPRAFALARARRLIHRADERAKIVAAVANTMARVTPAGYLQASRMLACGDLISEAAQIRQSVEIIVGADDVITPPDNARRLIAALDKARPESAHRLHIAPEAGHAVCQEMPAFVAGVLRAAIFRQSVAAAKIAPAQKPNAGPIYQVPPVTRAIKLLRYLAAGHPAGNLSQVARHVGINRTTLLRLFGTLEAERFIERVGDGGDYALGAGLIELAAEKIFSTDVAQAATPVLARLAAEVGLSSHLGILQGREVIYVVRQAPNLHLVSNVRVGSRLPAHATTMGRIILAHLPSEEVARLYRDVKLVAATDKTAATLAALQLQLAADRAAGVAASQSNFEIGIDSFAAPIFNYTGMVVAAINVSGPESAFNNGAGKREAIAQALQRAAAEISTRLGYVTRPAPAAALATARKREAR